MDGRTLALGTISALALAGVVGQRAGGSRAFPNLRGRLVAILADFEEDDLAMDTGRLADLIARFAEVGVTLLASGSQRIVFDLHDGTVAKVDYSVGAIANRLEARNWREWRAVRPLLCPVLWTSPDDRLLLMPLAESITEPAAGTPPVKRRVKKMEAAIRTFGPGGFVHIFDADFELNWGWYNAGPVLLDYAQDPE